MTYVVCDKCLKIIFLAVLILAVVSVIAMTIVLNATDRIASKTFKEIHKSFDELEKIRGFDDEDLS